MGQQRKENMKEYQYTAGRTFWQRYKITVKAKNEEQADDIVYNLRYNEHGQWDEVGNLIPDDKLVDIELVDDPHSEQLINEK